MRTRKRRADGRDPLEGHTVTAQMAVDSTVRAFFFGVFVGGISALGGVFVSHWL